MRPFGFDATSRQLAMYPGARPIAIDRRWSGRDNSRMASALRRAAIVSSLLVAAAIWPIGAVGRSRGQAAAERSSTPAQVRQLLSDRCFRCHGPDASKRKAKLRLDTRDGLLAPLDAGMAIVTPRDPARSELIRRTHLA